MSLEFRMLEESRLEEAFAILRGFFGTNYYGANPKYFSWQYKECPFRNLAAEENEYSVLTAVENGEILALDAFLPWQTIVNGVPAKTFWDIEWISTGKRRGVGRELVTELRSRCEVYCGYGMNALSWAAYEKLGFNQRKHIERSIAILDASACNALFNPSNRADITNFLKENEAAPSRASVNRITRRQDLSEKYWEDQLSRFSGISYKGPEYIDWRFLKHPFVNYTVLAPDPHGKEGIATVRVEQVKNTDKKIIRILDMLPAIGHVDNLVGTVLAFARENDAIMADFFCASTPFAQAVCPDPFISLKSHLPYDLPMLFQPVEWRERKSINMMLDANPEFKDLGFDSMYSTKADGDQDILLNEGYATVSL